MWRLFLAAALTVCLLGGAWLGIGLLPISFGGAPTRTVQIPYGSGISRITGILEEQGLIRSPLAFRLWAKLSGGERAVKAGSYALTGSMSSPKILYTLTDGREQTYRVTIPEGANLKEIAAILDQRGIAGQAEFLARATDPQFAREVVPEAAGGTLEGFLFPDTYFFSSTTGAEGAIKIMAARFHQVMNEQLRARAAAMNRSVREIVIMAALVEKEAKHPEDRAKIAAVFYNRLRAGKALESCATVQYALGRHKDRLLYKDLHIDSPYNTYLHPGLPPGPIACPGLASLMAALYPDKDNYLYFVARPDGSHVFSKTYAEHLRAKREIANGR